ncbi:hypothetical protein J4Q44_G00286460 [Coregonus suidteri]|uniref:Sortilin-related VPS10 domain containing receptor 3 n=1 Tax=Coregonus suidteri TaxID=861788 RepID=A0AAN8KYQ2_9TELE
MAMNGVEKITVYQRSGSTHLLYQGAAAKDRTTSTAQGTEKWCPTTASRESRTCTHPGSRCVPTGLQKAFLSPPERASLAPTCAPMSPSWCIWMRCPVEHVQLLAPFVAIKNKEVNLTAVVWPIHSRTLSYFWWLGNSTELVISLDGSISYTFTSEEMNTVTVQMSSANAILQDKTIAVQEFFKSLLLSFSPNLDEFNPDVPEWRQDVGRVIKKALLQVSDFQEDQLLVAVFPGVPTSTELFLLPHKNQSEGRKKSEEELKQISEILASALDQNLVEFELKPGERVIVYITQLTLAPLVDSSPRHSSSAMLMLLSVVFLGLAVFLIYKFKRKIPWINIYAEVNQEKEQEMIGSVSQNDSTPKITLSEFSTPTEVLEKEMDARVKWRIGNACESTREIPNCTSV